MRNTLYSCDPAKNIECSKTACFLNGGPCKHTTKEVYKMEAESIQELVVDNEATQEHEIRYYLKYMLNLMNKGKEAFKPSYIVTAVKLPTGAIELAVNTECIKEKAEYILSAYDDEMHLKTNADIVMQNLMIV